MHPLIVSARWRSVSSMDIFLNITVDNNQHSILFTMLRHVLSRRIARQCVQARSFNHIAE